MPNNTTFHLEAWFSGNVQGVGFRYSTMYVAKGFKVSGTVKNLLDGRVWLVAEGEESEVHKFFQELQDYMHAYIDKVESNTSSLAEPSFDSFSIIH